MKGSAREEVYGWLDGAGVERGYNGQNREAKGLLRQYVAKMTGLSRAQTRLIGQYRITGEVKQATYQRHRFAGKYTRADNGFSYRMSLERKGSVKPGIDRPNASWTETKPGAEPSVIGS